MQLAINFSDPASELLAAGKIRLDRFKTPDWLDLIERATKQLPVYIHFAINAGADDSKTRDWAAADALARATDTPFVNLHLAPRAKDFVGRDERAVVDAMMNDVTKAVQFFGTDRVIVENIPLGNLIESFAEPCAKTDVIHEIVELTGAGFLLDLSHARLTARHWGLDAKQYVESLPVKKIRELHLTGLQFVEGRLRDHMPMGPDDWQMAQWAFDRIRAGDWAKPWMIAFEYGGVGEGFAWRTDRKIIEEQIPRLWEMVKESAI
ncbi:MAG: DUF692 family multinuclear iron-containing protein [Tepidisphaeraceae bacterium]